MSRKATIDIPESTGRDGAIDHAAKRVVPDDSLGRLLYRSPNGDRWLLNRDVEGRLFVSHHPNVASGGQITEIGVEEFLSRGRHGPEHQALLEALAKLKRLARAEGQEELSREATDKLSRTLGQAVARCWSSLPQEIQQDLFEAAVASEGEAIRHQLAIYLHGKHQRTLGAAQARAMPEPDSLGG